MLTTIVLALALTLHVAAGSPEGRVVNGVEVAPHSFPWQLSLQHISHISHICGAVVLNRTHAITAAHCVGGSPSNYRVVCGAHNIRQKEPGTQTMYVAGIRIHPHYRASGSEGYPNDVAVLTLSGSLTMDDKCQAAQLDEATDYNGHPAVITGWGRLSGGGALPAKLKRGEVEALSHARCSGYWWSIKFTPHVCVKDLGDKIYGGCNGDSGGPAHVNGKVIGLASFVFGSCSTSSPTVYARVGSYINWIRYNELDI